MESSRTDRLADIARLQAALSSRSAHACRQEVIMDNSNLWSGIREVANDQRRFGSVDVSSWVVEGLSFA